MDTKRKTTIQNKINIPQLFNIPSLLPRCLKFVQVVAANIYERPAPQALYSFHLWRDKSRA